MSSSTGNTRADACEFTENLQILRHIDFFAGLPLDALKVIAYLFTRETFAAGDRLFQQNSNDGQAFYIFSGTARLFREEEQGEIVVRDFGPGDFLGGLALCADVPRLFSLKAVTEIDCMILTREKFSKVMEQFPQLLPAVLKAVVVAVRTWEERLFLGETPVSDVCVPTLGVSML
ncbi:MAG: cyclic nucleotide-binding domain-containing protein [Deltaproteobacteria bacterium]|nr:cyclic nucleotide-binding domain-containing protein [Deltaproteobacteria bacterium]MBW2072592.1 cyclic nucleotide-binding domain-containing protein [Deltaproteobacteria bacterium]